MIFELEPTFWRRQWFSSLGPYDLLNLLKTCKFFQKDRMYIYKLIFIIADRKGEEIVTHPIAYDSVELIKIVKLFLYNPELNKLMKRRTRCNYSIDLTFARAFKIYFIDKNYCNNETSCDKVKPMDGFINYVRNYTINR